MHPHHESRASAHERRLRHDPQAMGDLVPAQAEHPGVTLEVLRELSAPVDAITASIFLPTHRSGPDMRQDHIRLKNLLTQVRRQAPHLEMTLQTIQEQVEPASFWAHPTEGLAWFCDAGGSRHFWLPQPMPELVSIGRHRHLKPLITLLLGDGPFHLLELHQHGVRLHSGSRFAMHQVPLTGIPTRVEDLPHAGDGQQDVEVRSANAVSGSPVWFGGAPEQDRKDLVLRYFRAVDEGVRAAVQVDQMPLVLAGVGWLLPLYRQANRHPRLLATDLPLDTAAMDAKELHAIAWEAAAPCYVQRTQEAIERHASAHGTARRAEILSDCLVCASAGRCESLLVASDLERWGTYVDGAMSVGEHGLREPLDEDLLNVAVVLALRTGAEVFAIAASSMPGGDPVSALLRY
jgi:hypothetical protein